MIDLTGWFPTGPLTTLYALIVMVVTIPIMRWGSKDNANIAALLFCGWCVARTATWLDVVHLQPLGTMAIIWGLWHIGTRPALFILKLCCLKLFVYGVYILGGTTLYGMFFSQRINVEQMWVASETLAYLQIIVLFGGTIDGNAVGLYFRSVLHRCGDFLSGSGVSARRQPVHASNGNMDKSPPNHQQDIK